MRDWAGGPARVSSPEEAESRFLQVFGGFRKTRLPLQQMMFLALKDMPAPVLETLRTRLTLAAGDDRDLVLARACLRMAVQQEVAPHGPDAANAAGIARGASADATAASENSVRGPGARPCASRSRPRTTRIFPASGIRARNARSRSWPRMNCRAWSGVTGIGSSITWIRRRCNACLAWGGGGPGRGRQGSDRYADDPAGRGHRGVQRGQRDRAGTDAPERPPGDVAGHGDYAGCRRAGDSCSFLADRFQAVARMLELAAAHEEGADLASGDATEQRMLLTLRRLLDDALWACQHGPRGGRRELGAQDAGCGPSRC